MLKPQTEGFSEVFVIRASRESCDDVMTGGDSINHGA